MEPPAAPAPAPLRWEGDEFYVDPEFAAPRLGLDTEQFRRAMRHGAVVGTVERGVAEDAGRTRVTLRRGDRVWRAVLEADGRVVEQS